MKAGDRVRLAARLFDNLLAIAVVLVAPVLVFALLWIFATALTACGEPQEAITTDTELLVRIPHCYQADISVCYNTSDKERRVCAEYALNDLTTRYKIYIVGARSCYQPEEIP